MKFMHILAAAGILVTSVAAAPAAEAQRYRGDYQYRDGDYRDGRYRDHRRYERRYNWNRGRYYDGRRHQRCWIERRRGGPVRVCRVR